MIAGPSSVGATSSKRWQGDTSDPSTSSAICELCLNDLQVESPSTPDDSYYFSWNALSSRQNFQLISYQIIVRQDEEGSNLWNSGVVPQTKSRLIRYAGKPLLPNTPYFWALRIETSVGTVTSSSAFTTGPSLLDVPFLPFDIQRRDDPLADLFQSSDWIWTPEADMYTPPLAPTGDRAFRRTYTPPSGRPAISADILIAVDDEFVLYVNGQNIGTSPPSTDELGWRNAQRYTVSLISGTNIFAIRATNLNDPNTGGDSSAGVLIAIMITLSDGTTTTITGDTSWKGSSNIPNSFIDVSFDDSSWETPIILGQYGMSPWSTQVVVPTSASSVSSSPSSASADAASARTATSTLVVTSNVVTTIGGSTPSSASSGSTTGTSSHSSDSNVTTGSSTKISTGAVAGNTAALTAPLTINSSLTSSAAVGAQTGTSKSGSSPSGAIIGGAVGGVVIVAMLVAVVVMLCRRRLFGRKSQESGHLEPFGGKDNVEMIGPQYSSENLLVRPFTAIAPNTAHRGASPITLDGKGPSPSKSDQLTSDLENSTQASFIVSPAEIESTRLRRMRALMAELNREIELNGEASTYVSELRGRIAELSEASRDNELVPPPYHAPQP